MAVHFAAEQRPFDVACDEYPTVVRHAKQVLDRIASVHALPRDARIADIGAGQGLFLVACAKQGYSAIGIEPWEGARATAEQFADLHQVQVSMLPGYMERIPLETNSVDFVHANSVVEHVSDAQASFDEAYRVLKPGGIFWFSAASSMCPKQNEIRGFPAFGWYPGMLKKRIMDWAKDRRPELIAHTATPAYNWFTPWKARRMLRKAGFTKIYDRWDLRLPTEGGTAYQFALRIIKLNAMTRLIADMGVPCCSYAAIK